MYKPIDVPREGYSLSREGKSRRLSLSLYRSSSVFRVAMHHWRQAGRAAPEQVRITHEQSEDCPFHRPMNPMLSNCTFSARKEEFIGLWQKIVLSSTKNSLRAIFFPFFGANERILLK